MSSYRRATKRLRIELLSILILMVLAQGVVWLWGVRLGIVPNAIDRIWVPVIAAAGLLLALFALFDLRLRRSDSRHALQKTLRERRANKEATAATTQAILFGDVAEPMPRSIVGLSSLSAQLRLTYGWRWNYRQPWLLLTGNDAAIQALLPELAKQHWLITPDAVLLWHASVDGQVDQAWLQQVCKLRRRRPVDAVVWVIDDAVDLPTQHDQSRMSSAALHLSRIAEILCWSAPVHVLDVTAIKIKAEPTLSLIGCEFDLKKDAAAMQADLLALRNRLIPVSMRRLVDDAEDSYTGQLSQRLDTGSATLANWIAGLHGRGPHQRVRSVFFVQAPDLPVASTAAPTLPPMTVVSDIDPAVQTAFTAASPIDHADNPFWSYLCRVLREQPGRRIGWHPVTVGTTIMLCCIGVWTTGMVVSAITNRHALTGLQQDVQRLAHLPHAADRLRALLTLQQDIERYEVRTTQHTPWSTRFGLNQDEAILRALWTPYLTASRAMLVAPVQQNLETALGDLTRVRSDQFDTGDNRLAVGGHLALKTYLMLAHPERADASFLLPQLLLRWQSDINLPPGERSDLSERLFRFYAKHLASHADWRIAANDNLVKSSRQTLLAAIGVENAETTLYRRLLDDVGNRFPDQTLTTLTAGTDTRGLIRSAVVIPGRFTRQAWDGYLAEAIAAAAKRNRVASDWVLTGGIPPQAANQAPEQTPEALQAALTAQYFAEYAEQWQAFMNSLQWDSATNMPQAIAQLTVLTDARQSPVLALMKSLRYQGTAGLHENTLSDNLVAKAKDLVAQKTDATPLPPVATGPLSDAFGPILRLNENSDISLSRYVEQINTLRLKLQQINASADAQAQAKQLALTLFQDKASALTDTQAYARLLAASLGDQWAGMGDALFVRPVMQAAQTVLQPAQAGLNDAWNQHIATSWNKAFAGRYPFAQTDNDASFPELARFLQPQNGLISSFLQSQLAGVLELEGDQWVPRAGSRLNFDPEFLAAINLLQRIGARVLVQGEPQYRFELKPIPAPGVVDATLTIDGQKLHYYNQRETWQGMAWPLNQTQDVGTRLQWETEKAGSNERYEFTGRWGFIRMLERAHVDPVDSATYQLTWQAAPDAVPANATAGTQSAASDNMLPRAPMASASSELVYPLAYLMRTEAGRGPLEMLALRNFVMPTRIFMVGRARELAGKR